MGFIALGLDFLNVIGILCRKALPAQSKDCLERLSDLLKRVDLFSLGRPDK